MKSLRATCAMRMPRVHRSARHVAPIALALALQLSGCGTTIEIPSVSFQLPGTPAQVQVPTLKVPDLKAQELIAKVEALRASGGLRLIKAEAEALKTMFASPAANEFLGAVESLPAAVARKAHFNSKDNTWVSDAGYASLSKDAKALYREIDIDENRYYFGRQLSPLAYARAIDVASLHGMNSLSGLRLLDLSYGAVASPRLLASAGATVVAVDSDRSLAAIYGRPQDVGAIGGVNGRRGTLALFSGDFPRDAALRASVGTGFDVVTVVDIPNRRTSESDIGKLRLDPMATAVEHLRAFADVLKPNGLLVVYRVGTRDSKRIGATSKPWLSADDLSETGFRALAYEQNDDAAARQMAQLLRWDRTFGVSLNDFVASYTVLRR